MRLRYNCVECETESSLKRQIWGNGGWKNLHEWVSMDDVVESDGMEPIDYSQLVKQIGSEFIDNSILARFERITGQEAHYFLRRQIAFSHRDLEVILDRHEKKEPFFIYAGRGPTSDAMHIGHLINFRVAKWLSDVFEVPLLVMISDGKFSFQDDLLHRSKF